MLRDIRCDGTHVSVCVCMLCTCACTLEVRRTSVCVRVHVSVRVRMYVGVCVCHVSSCGGGCMGSASRTSSTRLRRSVSRMVWTCARALSRYASPRFHWSSASQPAPRASEAHDAANRRAALAAVSSIVVGDGGGSANERRRGDFGGGAGDGAVRFARGVMEGGGGWLEKITVVALLGGSEWSAATAGAAPDTSGGV